MGRAEWIRAAQRVIAGERKGIVCPANGDAELSVEWIPAAGDVGGEFRLTCPACGEVNFVLVRGEEPAPSSAATAAPGGEGLVSASSDGGENEREHEGDCTSDS